MALGIIRMQQHEAELNLQVFRRHFEPGKSVSCGRCQGCMKDAPRPWAGWRLLATRFSDWLPSNIPLPQCIVYIQALSFPLH